MFVWKLRWSVTWQRQVFHVFWISLMRISLIYTINAQSPRIAATKGWGLRAALSPVLLVAGDVVAEGGIRVEVVDGRFSCVLDGAPEWVFTSKEHPCAGSAHANNVVLRYASPVGRTLFHPQLSRWHSRKYIAHCLLWDCLDSTERSP
jgi:hypothetical protein